MDNPASIIKFGDQLLVVGVMSIAIFHLWRSNKEKEAKIISIIESLLPVTQVLQGELKSTAQLLDRNLDKIIDGNDDVLDRLSRVDTSVQKLEAAINGQRGNGRDDEPR